MRGIKLLAASAALGVCVSGLAGCLGGPSRPDPDASYSGPPSVLLSSDALLFVSFDADNDGRTSAADLDAGVLREWARADRNQDGVLTPLEFSDWARSALGGPQLPPYRLNFDRNVDNSITRAEFADELRARFDEYDANHDGAVTRAEMLRPGPQARPQMTRDGPRGEGGRSGEHRPNGEGDGPNSQGGGTGDGRPPL